MTELVAKTAIDRRLAGSFAKGPPATFVTPVRASLTHSITPSAAAEPPSTSSPRRAMLPLPLRRWDIRW